jgi:glycosyltransferase involved in cell wall biosynthesis
VETILDGVNPDYYQDFLLKENLKKELELPSDKVIVCYTGSLLANKGINYLMRAILNLGKKRDDLYFIVAGFPTEKVKEYVEENNLSEKTRLVNPLSYFDLPKILGACDIAVDPKDSQTSQASGKILQYMAAGLPVVCFNRPNNRKYLEEGAYFSGSFDAEGLSKGIEFFADNAGERKIRGEYNRKRAQIFSWDAPAEKVEKIYKKLRDS